MSTPTKYLLQESQIPKFWYNIAADLPVPLPAVLHPGTLQPIGPADLAPLFPMAIIQQEVSTEREIDIPEPVREVLRLWRPSPLFRAHRLEKLLGTPAKIYYKYEGVSPAGSHKPNSAVPAGLVQRPGGRQAAVHRDRRRPVGQLPGAGAGRLFGLDVTVFQVRVSATTRSLTAVR
jgi:tryptophan synthase beta chain